MINYIEYDFKIIPQIPGNDIVIAQLAEVGFDSFTETADGVLAYIQADLENKEEIKEIQILSNDDFDITFETKNIEPTNWNEEWEKNFSAINVEDKCMVRAPFHEAPTSGHDILIVPKMSFGTGHHETTYMMIKHLLNADVQDKTVMDMGCGTAILAILAKKMGAAYTEGIDIDEWAYDNAMENLDLNNVSFPVKMGGAEKLDKSYDIFLANINRNILLNDVPHYAEHINKDGFLFLSGFYEKDFDLINAKCSENNLTFISKLETNHWQALCYKKS